MRRGTSNEIRFGGHFDNSAMHARLLTKTTLVAASPWDTHAAVQRRPAAPAVMYCVRCSCAHVYRLPRSIPPACVRDSRVEKADPAVEHRLCGLFARANSEPADQMPMHSRELMCVRTCIARSKSFLPSRLCQRQPQHFQQSLDSRGSQH